MIKLCIYPSKKEKALNLLKGKQVIHRYDYLNMSTSYPNLEVIERMFITRLIQQYQANKDCEYTLRIQDMDIIKRENSQRDIHMKGFQIVTMTHPSDHLIAELYGLIPQMEVAFLHGAKVTIKVDQEDEIPF